VFILEKKGKKIPEPEVLEFRISCCAYLVKDSEPLLYRAGKYCVRNRGECAGIF
jgi:hypothetical protein